jgi:site-specific DNA-methyltransferase (adenine-specific)
MIKTLVEAQSRGVEVNSIYNADCLDVLKLIPDKSIDLILTDPPYLINYKTNYRKDKTHEFCSAIQNDSNVDIVPLYIKEYHRVLKDDTALYLFCSCDKIDYFKQQIEQYFKIKNIIIWIKNNWTAGDLQA